MTRAVGPHSHWRSRFCSPLKTGLRHVRSWWPSNIVSSWCSCQPSGMGKWRNARTCTGLEILHGICRQRWKKQGKGPHAFVLGLRVKKVKDGEMANSESKAVHIGKMPLQNPCGRKLPFQAVFTQWSIALLDLAFCESVWLHRFSTSKNKFPRH